jgi:hypothetical protein
MAGNDETARVNLQIVSPSAGISQRLVFSDLPANSTLKQLKERIRNSVPARPADDHQRLIHRGRMLPREDDTLETILGAEAVSSPLGRSKWTG